MARKRYSDEDILNLLWQIELDLNTGSDVASACRKAGISDATYYTWRKRYGGMAKSQLQEFKTLEHFRFILTHSRQQRRSSCIARD